MLVLSEKPSATQRKHEKALIALKKATTDEVRIMQFPDGSMLIKLTPHDVRKKKTLPDITADKQRYLLDSIPDKQAEEDSE